MKFLILALCFCLAVADNAKLIDELEKILSADANAPPDTSILDKLGKLDAPSQDEKILDKLDALSQDAEKPKETEKPVGVRGDAYGYCLDGKTPADGPNMKGCARKLCYDESPAECNRVFEKLNKLERKRECRRNLDLYKYYRARCPYSCGFCKPPSPKQDCQEKYGDAAPHGCCWDGMPALRPDQSDCMRCTDMTPHTCGQFYNDMFGEKCGTNSIRIRQFLYMRCPRLCGRCFP